MGKTSATLYVLKIFKVIGMSLPALVLAPRRVARSVWPEEIRKWSEFSDLRVSVMAESSAKKRTKAFYTPADIYTINYESLQWLERVVQASGRRFLTIVADESTRLKGFRLKGGGRRALALKRMIGGTERFVNLTGTPASNGIIDLWGQQYFIDQGARLGRTFTDFKARWFDSGSRWQKFAKDKPLPYAENEIIRVLGDCTVSLRPEDWFDLRAPVVSTVTAYLPKKARQIYRDLERRMYADLSTGYIEAVTAAAKTIKCLQVANGAAYLSSAKRPEDIHDGKLEALDDVIEELAGENIIVAYHFRCDLERLKARYPQGEELDKNPLTIERWNRGEIPLLFAHPASAGHGLNLQHGGRVLVFFGHWWSYEHYAQMVERIGPVRQLQSGYDRAVLIYHIVAEGTVDEDVIANREGKKSVQEIILERMRRGAGV